MTKWLKSPWFWVALVALVALIWWLMNRPSSGSSTSVPGNTTRSTTGFSLAGIWNALQSIGARYSGGDTIYSGGGGSG